MPNRAMSRSSRRWPRARGHCPSRRIDCSVSRRTDDAGDEHHRRTTVARDHPEISTARLRAFFRGRAGRRRFSGPPRATPLGSSPREPCEWPSSRRNRAHPLRRAELPAAEHGAEAASHLFAPDNQRRFDASRQRRCLHTVTSRPDFGRRRACLCRNSSATDTTSSWTVPTLCG